ncbi:uncharacterized protein LOC105802994 [Gossypium raimondii]|uniref:DUF789 domain-containing protein n=2 Tax=Gossypium raimondii TaxID=29730 RepID=A0A0D2SIU8_GOSRA|nr:uncharacterized protein LOC105802994 [Gossypium raimondii]KJB41890.1 hypothetical protein B456_007G126100 [Gossypium raimondii]KJB41891.1 hypothetical protein B456_007G126100 [Gossypium raimondii]KJB41892.1 hypothetical protein B456_007G126100 [Gossypium raimondii]
MSNSGGYAVARTQTRDRFYNPPALRRHQQLQRRQLTHRPLLSELRKPSDKESRVNSVDSVAETRADSDDSTLSRPNSVCYSSPNIAKLTNLDRLMESVTPFVPAHCFSEAQLRGKETREVDLRLYYWLGDLWECFSEWSVYGVGVPLLLNGSDSVKQYYVPYLSGIQLYVDPHQPRRTSDIGDAESSREISSAGTSDSETDRRVKGGIDGAWAHHNSERTNGSPMSTSSDEVEVGKSNGQLVFEYFEQEQPHHRKPLYDKISSLASQFPEIRMYRSCELLPASWISVAWYPIYRIPMGPTLQNLDASFLTFHSLSTRSQSKNQLEYSASSSRKACGVDPYSNISLPVFGLASYKLRGSILTPGGIQESQQASSLLQAADNWLQCLQVRHPDFQFFLSHNSQWR